MIIAPLLIRIMMKTYLLYLIVILLCTYACKKALTEPEEGKVQGFVESTKGTLLSRASIDDYITNMIQTKGEFKWADASENIVWSALNKSDKVLSIGYKPEVWTVDDVGAKMHTINLQSKEWLDAKQQILQLVLEEERKSRPNLKIVDLEVWPEKYLPVIYVSAQCLSTIETLRASKLVRYVEPIGYCDSTPVRAAKNQGNSLKSVDWLFNFGCNGAPAYAGQLLQDTDYSLVSPLSKASWNYDYHHIQAGWRVSSGRGIKVMIIDTGSSERQENLGANFNQGESYGRSIEHLVTLPSYSPSGAKEMPDDICGHGTRMAGILAAPRGADGSACGIAYNCDLVTVRAAESVLLNQSREVKGVADAFNLAAHRDDIKIISMSMGYISHISTIADAVRNAANRGKLIFCAAGTSSTWTSWLPVVFPANMPEVNAVTGIKDNLKERCTTCHEGPEVDFVVVMQKGDSGLGALTLASNGFMPATVGGSSAATASMAGMAALVWSKNPEKSAADILTTLRHYSTNPTNNINWGFGLLDVGAALGVN